jgi:hypothetical protein
MRPEPSGARSGRVGHEPGVQVGAGLLDEQLDVASIERIDGAPVPGSWITRLGDHMQLGVTVDQFQERIQEGDQPLCRRGRDLAGARRPRRAGSGWAVRPWACPTPWPGVGWPSFLRDTASQIARLVPFRELTVLRPPSSTPTMPARLPWARTRPAGAAGDDPRYASPNGGRQAQRHGDPDGECDRTSPTAYVL